MHPGDDKIRREIADILGISEDRVSDELAAGSIPEWDSLAQLAIVSTLEEKYKLHIPEEQLMQLSSVAAIEEYVTRGELLAETAMEINGGGGILAGGRNCPRCGDRRHVAAGGDPPACATKTRTGVSGSA